MMHYLKDGTLVITSGDRIDNILVSVSAHLMSQRRKIKISGIILTGGLIPEAKIMNVLKKTKIPVLLSNEDTYKVAGKVEALTCKIEKTDKDKIAEASQLVKDHVDVEVILENL
jgi:BioD-like phosphotransacetylase family protein